MESNLDSLKLNINISKLSQTFRDAMETTRNLGVRYIWIDSLCIIQDSKEDWEHEAALMGSVYEHSYCNIAASKASNGNDGCFTTRNIFDVQQCNVMAYWHKQEPMHYYIRDNAPWDQLNHDPLVRRGWVVQESILARRILHFSKEQVLWECSEVRLSETIPFTSNQPFYHRLNLDPTPYLTKKYIRPWAHPETPDLVDYAIWRDFVHKYSCCQLTYPEKDKLVAVSGIARLLCRGDEYLAGLWRKCLPAQLMWHTQNFGPKRPSKYYAPTWSWASVDGIISMRGTIAHESSSFTVLDAQVTTSSTDRFGAVSAGYLQVLGPVAKTFYQPVYNPNSSIAVRRTNEAACLLGRSLCAIYRDIHLPNGPIFLLPFIMPSAEQRSKADSPVAARERGPYENPFFALDTPCGLVLGRWTDKKGLYQRLGYFRILAQDDTQNMQYFYELFLTERENLSEEDYEERIMAEEPSDLPKFQITIV
jgi:hypothetical protein